MARITQSQFRRLIGWWFTFAANPRGWNPVTNFTRETALNNVARLMVKAHLAARAERERRVFDKTISALSLQTIGRARRIW